MSLLDEAFEAFTVVNKSIVNDGYGGVTTTWTDGATIQGAIVYDNSNISQIAMSMGVMSAYTFTVRKSVELDFNTVLRRESDSKVFRLTSDSKDKRTPQSAGLDMRQYTAEVFVIPN